MREAGPAFWTLPRWICSPECVSKLWGRGGHHTRKCPGASCQGETIAPRGGGGGGGHSLSLPSQLLSSTMFLTIYQFLSLFPVRYWTLLTSEKKSKLQRIRRLIRQVLSVEMPQKLLEKMWQTESIFWRGIVKMDLHGNERKIAHHTWGRIFQNKTLNSC